MLIDTDLQDSKKGTSFETNTREISSETVIKGNSNEKYWINASQNISLMGSVANPVNSYAKAPDFIHFANWIRLNNSSWNLKLQEGRSFSGNAAVCYVYEPAALTSGSSFTYTIFLTAEDIDWYMSGNGGSIVSRILNQINPDDKTDANMHILLRLQELLQTFISGEITLSRQDILEIEETIERYR